MSHGMVQPVVTFGRDLRLPPPGTPPVGERQRRVARRRHVVAAVAGHHVQLYCVARQVGTTVVVAGGLPVTVCRTGCWRGYDDVARNADVVGRRVPGSVALVAVTFGERRLRRHGRRLVVSSARRRRDVAVGAGCRDVAGRVAARTPTAGSACSGSARSARAWRVAGRHGLIMLPLVVDVVRHDAHVVGRRVPLQVDDGRW